MDIKTNSLHAWLLASRPKTLTAAVIPILTGTSLALTHGQFRPAQALLCLLFACGMQIAANFINDLYDFRKGSDREDRLGPERACAQGWITPQAMKWGIGLALGLSCLMGIGVWAISFQELPYKGMELIVTGILCVIFAFLYTTRLSYIGMGDVLVLIFFGFIPVSGTFYVQAGTLTAATAVASLACGLSIDTLLAINNYRDRDQDKVSGKHTLVVRYGEPFGRYFYLSAGIAAAAASLYFADGWDIIFPLTYLVLHTVTWRKLVKINHGKQLNSILGETSRNMLFMGICLSATILIH